VILLRVFTLGRAIEFQDGVDTDFPDSLGDGRLLIANSRARSGRQPGLSQRELQMRG
jgi:hypothetical protein